MAEAEVESFWQRQRLAEAEVKKPHVFILFVHWEWGRGYPSLWLKVPSQPLVPGVGYSSLWSQVLSTWAGIPVSGPRSFPGGRGISRPRSGYPPPSLNQDRGVPQSCPRSGSSLPSGQHMPQTGYAALLRSRRNTFLFTRSNKTPLNFCLANGKRKM